MLLSVSLFPLATCAAVICMLAGYQMLDKQLKKMDDFCCDLINKHVSFIDFLLYSNVFYYFLPKQISIITEKFHQKFT